MCNNDKADDHALTEHKAVAGAACRLLALGCVARIVR